MDDNRVSCLLNSFALILDEDPKRLIAEIGHDGMETVFPSLPYPFNKRGFHPRELIDCCLKRGYGVTQIERNPLSMSCRGETIRVPISEESFFAHLMRGDGVLAGYFTPLRPHAVCWKNQNVVDKNKIYEGLGGFTPKVFFLVTQTKQSLR